MVENNEDVNLSEKKYSLLFKNSISCIAFHEIVYDSNDNPIDYVITDVNPMFEKVMHFKKEKVVGVTSTKLYRTDEPPFFDIFLNVAETLKPTSFTTKFDILNRYYKISVFSFKKGTFVTVFEDFTDHMEAIEKLKEKEDELKNINLDLEEEIKKRTKKISESEIKFQKIIESIPMGIHMYKLEPDGRLVFIGANPAADSILGVDNSLFIGKTIEEAFPPLIETEVPKQYRKVAKEGGLWSTEQVDYQDDQIKGAFEVYAFQTSPGQMAAFFLDISERLRAELKLKESEEKYYAIFNQAADAITITDPEKGEIIEFNFKSYENLGYTHDEFKKLKISDYSMSESEEEVINHIKNIIEKGSDIFEAKFKTKSGQLKDMLINTKLITIQNKHYIQAISRDITDLKLAEEKFQQAYQLAEFYKDLFAHDISNIMQNILTSIELCSIYSKKKDDPNRIQSMYDLIKSQVKRGANLVSNVRKLSSLEESSLKIESIDIDALLNNSIKKLGLTYPDIKINLKIEPKKENIRVQSTPLLKDVFENVLNNAVIHNDNKEIEIIIRISEDLLDNIKYLKLEFIDNGRGVIDSQKKDIFERQMSEDQKSIGMGLGLSLIKRIIQGIRGKVWVEDRVRGDYTKGCNFVLLIPNLL